ncbi:hypothetical protein JTB14_017835 [Gonioctena quinquepunctata]|nr:hypothetical protein JTB14_017835 [Gonioctena quinquepunctata]
MTEATKFRRDAPLQEEKEKNAAQAMEEAYSLFRMGVDDIVKKIGDNEYVQILSKSFRNFVESVQQQGGELINKLKTVRNKESVRT